MKTYTLEELKLAPPSTPAPDYGEPWRLTDSDTAHALTRNDEAALFPVASMRRAVACTNALAGISDPAAFVAQAKANAEKLAAMEQERIMQDHLESHL